VRKQQPRRQLVVNPLGLESRLTRLGRVGRAVLPGVALVLSISGMSQARSEDLRCAADPPDLTILEAQLPTAPDLRSLLVQGEQERRRRHWSHRIQLRFSYTQHYSTAAPFVPTSDPAVSGGSYVGATASIPLGELIGRAGPDELNIQLKELQFQKLRLEKRAELHRLAANWKRQRVRLTHLDSRLKAAELALVRIRTGLELGARYPELGLNFTVVDLAGAEESVAAVEAQQAEACLEIDVIRASIAAILGTEQP
jgi:outer membrane protein TolC